MGLIKAEAPESGDARRPGEMGLKHRMRANSSDADRVEPALPHPAIEEGPKRSSFFGKLFGSRRHNELSSTAGEGRGNAFGAMVGPPLSVGSPTRLRVRLQSPGLPAGGRGCAAAAAAATGLQRAESSDVVYLAPLEFRGPGSTSSERSSRSDNSSANLQRVTGDAREGGRLRPTICDARWERPQQSTAPRDAPRRLPPLSVDRRPIAECEWIIPASAKRVAFQMPQKAMHGRRHGSSFTRSHKQHRRTKSSHTSGHSSRRAHGRRAKRPGAHHRNHLRRRYYLHGGAMAAEAAAAGAAGMFGLGEDNMFDEGEESDMLQMRYQDTESEEEEEEADDDDAASDKKVERPPPLENDDQHHVFFYYVGSGNDVDIVEHYIAELEGAPTELKCLTNERDFKPDLSSMQNVVLAVGLSQRTVLLCTQEFIDNDYESFNSAANFVMTDEEKKLKIFVILPPDVDLPKGLQRNKIFHLTDEDALNSLTRTLCSGPVPKELYKVEPTAPPLDTGMDETEEAAPPVEIPKEPSTYQNGTIIRKVTADNYKEFETFNDEDTCRACRHCFGDCDVLCPLPEPQFEVPPQLRKRGLLVQQAEFQEMLQALSDASRIKFFHKAVDCSLPCLYLCIILVAIAVLAPVWFLSIGIVKHERPQEDHSSAIFWSFFLCILIVPALVAIAALALLVHLANAKYAKFRCKLEEFNKRFRETNLVLHCSKAYWYCSGRLKLFFIYYNFEECQQNLYYQVYEHMKYTGNGSTCNSSTTGHTTVGSDLNGNGHVVNYNGLDSYGHADFEVDIPTLKMDKILKRVNTLRKKYEWDYFEELTTKRLPEVDEKQHRKGGMCFCQYVLRRNMHDDPISWAELVKERCEATLRNAFRKSHVRRQLRTNLHANGSVSGGSNGTVPHSKPDVVYI